jgi:hypothetical protein
MLEQLTHPELELNIYPNVIWNSFPMLGAEEQHKQGEQRSNLHENATQSHLVFAFESQVMLFFAFIMASRQILPSCL